MLSVELNEQQPRHNLKMRWLCFPGRALMGEQPLGILCKRFCEKWPFHRTKQIQQNQLSRVSMFTRKLSTHAFSRKKVEFGLCLDIDGVLARGTTVIPGAQRAMDMVKTWAIPAVFVTNASSPKAKLLSNLFNTKVYPEQVIQAQSPLSLYTEVKQKHCLVIGQGNLQDVTRTLGFTNICTVEDVRDAYPLLDIGDHERRAQIESSTEERGLAPVEAIILMGEPKHWETSLQLVIDLLMTNGKPYTGGRRQHSQTLPVFACNMDLQYMHKASYPRYGHGSFLLCLEALFKKLTGKDLTYSTVVGKPSEVTFRYAEHCLALEAQRVGLPQPIKRLYMIGDNREVDIVGANLYQRYITQCRQDSSATKYPDIPPSRTVPDTCELLPQTVDTVYGILVRTGVYQESGQVPDTGHPTHPNSHSTDHSLIYSHRDFPLDSDSELVVPHVILNDVLEAMEYIFQREGSGCGDQ